MDHSQLAQHMRRGLHTTRSFEFACQDFNRGQRSFFLALGNLGCFVSRWVLS